MLAALDALQPRDAAGEDVLRKLRAYVVEHTARMDYPGLPGAALPLGSGAIESTVKNLIQHRQVLAGMRWTREGAHFVANLRALHRSVGRWDAFGRSQPLRRLQALLAPPATALAAPDQTVPTPLHEPPLAPSCTETPQDDTPPQPTRSRAARIQTEGKPWGKGKDFWHRSPFGRRRFA